MPRPLRSEQFQANEICIGHITQRCVRRTFLTGFDEQTGIDYSHRREWIRYRMEALASVFGVDVLTYAIMSNHLHIIVRNRPDVVCEWTNEEVAIRWLRVFPGRRIDEQLADPTQEDVKKLAKNVQKIKQIRSRLSDISWFMRALSEPIARYANKQDNCTGRFWEGRFKAQRIVDEAGLLACAMYVDLNPIRAQVAETLDTSMHTSAYDRIKAELGEFMPSAAFDLATISAEEAGEDIQSKSLDQRKQDRSQARRNPTGKRILRDGWLAPITLVDSDLSSNPQVHRDGFRASDKGFLNLSWHEYLALLRWTSQQKTSETTGMSDRLSNLLSSVGIEASMWRDLVWNYTKYFGNSSCAGRPESMAADAVRIGKSYHRGQSHARACFVSPK